MLRNVKKVKEDSQELSLTLAYVICTSLMRLSGPIENRVFFPTLATDAGAGNISSSEV